MNKNISKVVLGLVISSMVIVGISISINQPKYDLIDMQGNRENIGDVNLISHVTQSIYTNTVTTLSKDGFDVTKYKKEIPYVLENSNISKENKEFVKDAQRNLIYQDSNDIGYLEYVFTNQSYDGVHSNKMKITNKNLKTNKVEEFEINIEEKIDTSNNNENEFLVSKYKDNIYITSLFIKDIEYSDQGGYISSNTSSKTYSFNLKTQELKLVKEASVNSKDSKIMINRYISFVHDNKSYFAIDCNLDNEFKTYIAYYDNIKNEYGYIKEPINSEISLLNADAHSMTTYSIEDDMLNIIIQDDSDEKYMHVRQYSVDLKNNKIINQDKIYKIEKIYKESRVDACRVLDGKLYMYIEANNFSNKRTSQEKKEKNSVIVFDEKTKKVLYSGKYIEDDARYVNHYILTDEEL